MHDQYPRADRAVFAAQSGWPHRFIYLGGSSDRDQGRSRLLTRKCYDSTSTRSEIGLPLSSSAVQSFFLHLDLLDTCTADHCDTKLK